MAREQATTIFLLLWLLYRRMVAGKDRRRELSEPERELFFGNVSDKCERQGAGIGNVQVFVDEDGKQYVGHLDWWRALGWPKFNTPNMNHGRIIGLMGRLKDLDWRQLGRDPSDLEALNHDDLVAIGLDPSHADTLLDLVSMQERGHFEWFRKFLLEECPHFADRVKTRKRKRSSKGRNIGIRRMTDKQHKAMDLKERGFTHAQIAKTMNLKNESSVVGLLQRGNAARQRIEAEVRRERASGHSIRSKVSLDAREGGESDD